MEYKSIKKSKNSPCIESATGRSIYNYVLGFEFISVTLVLEQPLVVKHLVYLGTQDQCDIQGATVSLPQVSESPYWSAE